VATPSPPTSTTSTPVTWGQLCGSPPGSDAPIWARTTLYNLYLGEGGPGAIVAGCTGPTQSTTGANFVYLVGSDLEYRALRSVAVVAKNSTKYPPALFLAPAAGRALALIHRNGPIGGSARFNFDSGDLQFMYTSKGTTLLIRSRKNLAGHPSYAAPYVELPPAVTELWFAHVEHLHTMVWVETRPDDPTTGWERFSFTTMSTTTPVATVEYDPATEAAYVKVRGGLRDRQTARRAEITLAALQVAVDVP
jgi:hypothetical protein